MKIHDGRGGTIELNGVMPVEDAMRAAQWGGIAWCYMLQTKDEYLSWQAGRAAGHYGLLALGKKS